MRGAGRNGDQPYAGFPRNKDEIHRTDPPAAHQTGTFRRANLKPTLQQCYIRTNVIAKRQLASDMRTHGTPPRYKRHLQGQSGMKKNSKITRNRAKPVSLCNRQRRSQT